MTKQEFAKAIKAKYPQYQNVDDTVLADKMVEKYPEYKSKITGTTAIPLAKKGIIQTAIEKRATALEPTLEAYSTGKQGLASSALQLTGQAAGALGDIGFEALKKITPSFIKEPAKKVITAVAETPMVKSTASAYEEWKKAHPEAARNLEATVNIAGILPETKLATTGVGMTTKAAGAATKATAKGAGKLAGEVFGITTGVGYGPIKEASKAVLAGGEKGAAYKAALRGGVSPEAIVDEARNGLETIVNQRREAYKEQLAKIAGETKQYDVNPIKEEVSKQLSNFNVNVNPDMTLDFSKSKIRFDKSAQSDIQNIFDTMATYGQSADDLTAVGIDNLKQALGDLYSPNSSVRAFVQGVKKKTTDILKKEVPGYEEMVKGYSEKTELINEIKKGLSLGDKAQTDTAFRKLASVLRQNNEFRRELLAELDKASGGELASKIAGQQLSEIAPRGLARTVGLGLGGAGFMTGVGIVPILKAAVLTSPRLVGEVISAMGFVGNKAKQVRELINKIPTTFDIDTSIKKAGKEFIETSKKLPSDQRGFIKIPIPQSSLIQEAKKYKSAEEFVKAQGTHVYHGTSLENANKINTEGFKAGAGKGVSGQASGDFVYATGNKVSANKYVSDRLGIKNPTTIGGSFNGKTLEIQGKMADFEAFGEASKKLGVPLEIGSQGKPTMLNMPAIKKAMQEQGYGAISFSDRYANGSKAFAILPENIKTKSKLEEIWNKAHGNTKLKSSNLIEEARKYKTAEEFVNSPKYEYHLSNNPNLETGKTFAEQSTKRPDVARRGLGNTMEEDNTIYSTNALDFWHTQLQSDLGKKAPTEIYLVEVKNYSPRGILESGFDAQASNAPQDVRIISKLGSTKKGFEPGEIASIKKSQLTDIWNKAHKNPIPKAK